VPDFVHLHVHTQYSILDGASDIRKLIARTRALGMSAVAITDHGNMYGVKEFHDVATREGIKPVIGCEVYVVKDRFTADKDEKAGDHLILLAKNLKGYQNLCKIVSYSYTEGFYYKPRIDKTLLREHREGLICSSACLGGEVQQAILRGDMRAAEQAVLEFRDIFGDDYYLEMQLLPAGDDRDREVYDNQVKVNGALVELGWRLGVKYIASNDVHFVEAGDAEAHDHLICLNTGKDLDDPNRMRYTFQEWLKSPDEMAALFPDHPEALATTLEIADKVETYSLDHPPLMPDFVPPAEFIEAEGLADNEMIVQQFRYLDHLAHKGARERYGEELPEEVKQRLRYELDTIEWMGFPGYFLIIWDLIRAAREMGISVGPGRGSAAGSVVAYALRITNIDPLKYDLLFERFLNPDRISLPDVDIDFDEDGRADVLNYVTEKYGKKRVAQIVTFGCMAPKMAIKDVARVQKLPLSESDRLTKLVPERLAPREGQTPFEHLYEVSAEMRAERDSSNQTIRRTLEYAEKLEGSVRQTGVHACGVIIGKDDLELYAPIATVRDKDKEAKSSHKKSDDDLKNVVQYEGGQVESIGLIKMDFLGLRTLSIIKDAVQNIEQVHGVTIDIDSVPLDDADTYMLFSHGDTHGLFQFESAGMRKHLRNLRPTRFEDLIAMNALYRPGPMDYIPSFIKRKNGDEAVKYDIPEMEEYLADTYGVTVYQEQVMLLSQKLAGFSGGEADTLRKAMGKKQKPVLEKMKPKFIEGATAKGHDPAMVDKVWRDWESFAEYAFNKSHSTCYAYIAYQTGWLKAHYPSEFMAAVLSRNLSNIKEITHYMQECRRMRINVLGPDVNESFHLFSSDKTGNVRFGLAGIKGVGEAAVRSIIEERRTGGRFKDIYDFMERINLQAVNKKTLEGLAVAGALDDISGFGRGMFFAEVADGSSAGAGGTFLEQLMRYGNRMQSERSNAQQSLFGEGSAQVAIQRPSPPATQDWSQIETLNREREAIGIYLSSHPLDKYRTVIRHLTNSTLADLADLAGKADRDFTVAGMVTGVQNLISQKGKPYGRVRVEDYDGNSHEFSLFDKDYEKWRIFFYTDYFLFIRGKITPRFGREGELEARITSVMQLDDVEKSSLREICVTLPLETLDGAFVASLLGATRSSEGGLRLALKVTDRKGGVSVKMFSRRHKVGLSGGLTDFLDDNELRYSIQ
jgi:DNA polymerase-3 subunit alpha